jgi:hypothetical protein
MIQARAKNATVGVLGDHTANLIRKAETLCRNVAGRDLEGHPLSIIASSQLPESQGGASICLGYTTPSLDLYLRDYIDDYRGRGPCMVIECPVDGDFLAEDVEHFTLVTALHELAHILERPSLYQERAGVDPAKLKFESLVVGQAVSKEPTLDLPLRYGHGINFIRICLHLRHRAAIHGTLIAPNNLCAGWQYGLSHASAYERALGNEPERMHDATFRQILNVACPQAFQELWSADTDE